MIFVRSPLHLGREMTYDEYTNFQTIMQSYVDCYLSSTEKLKSCEVIKPLDLLPQSIRLPKRSLQNIGSLLRIHSGC